MKNTKNAVGTWYRVAGIRPKFDIEPENRGFSNKNLLFQGSFSGSSRLFSWVN